jgi:hypothetical protein
MILQDFFPSEVRQLELWQEARQIKIWLKYCSSNNYFNEE